MDVPVGMTEMTKWKPGLRKLVCSLRYSLRYTACFAAAALDNRNNTVYLGFLSSKSLQMVCGAVFLMTLS